jgi:hypothetical protein
MSKSSTNHSFNVKLAAEYGINEAILIHPFDEVETQSFRAGRKPRSSFCCFNS